MPPQFTHPHPRTVVHRILLIRVSAGSLYFKKLRDMVFFYARHLCNFPTSLVCPAWLTLASPNALASFTIHFLPEIFFLHSFDLVLMLCTRTYHLNLKMLDYTAALLFEDKRTSYY